MKKINELQLRNLIKRIIEEEISGQINRYSDLKEVAYDIGLQDFEKHLRPDVYRLSKSLYTMGYGRLTSSEEIKAITAYNRGYAGIEI